MPQRSLKLDVIREALNIRTNKQTCVCVFEVQASNTAFKGVSLAGIQHDWAALL
jgi:hypothetical protein